MSNKRVFIVGAGASSIYGIPTGDKYLKYCLFDEVNKPYDQEAENVIKFLNNLIPGGEEEWINKPFEFVLSLIEKDKILNKKIVEKQDYENIDEQIITCLYKRFWHINNTLYEHFKAKTNDQIKKLDYPYKNFIKNINPLNDSIITTNYDVLIDRAIYLLFENIKYTEKSFQNSDKTPPLLLKPLGSLNWVPNLKPDVVISLMADDEKHHDFKVEEEMYKLSDNPLIWVMKKIPRYFEFPKISTIGKYSVIIPPTIGADTPTIWGELFIDLYKQIYNKIIDADEIFIIGYSFPPYYEFFRIFIRIALQTNKIIKNKDAKIFVIDKEDIDKKEDIRIVVKNYIRNLSESKESYYYGQGFEKWLNETTDWSNISNYKPL